MGIVIDEQRRDFAQRYTCRQALGKEIELGTAQPLVQIPAAPRAVSILHIRLHVRAANIPAHTTAHRLRTGPLKLPNY